MKSDPSCPYFKPSTGKPSVSIIQGTLRETPRLKQGGKKPGGTWNVGMEAKGVEDEGSGEISFFLFLFI